MIASSFVIIVNGLVFLIAGAQSVRRVFNDVWDGATVSGLCPHLIRLIV